MEFVVLFPQHDSEVGQGIVQPVLAVVVHNKFHGQRQTVEVLGQLPLEVNLALVTGPELQISHTDRKAKALAILAAWNPPTHVQLDILPSQFVLAGSPHPEAKHPPPAPAFLPPVLQGHPPNFLWLVANWPPDSPDHSWRSHGSHKKSGS